MLLLHASQSSDKIHAPYYDVMTSVRGIQSSVAKQHAQTVTSQETIRGKDRLFVYTVVRPGEGEVRDDVKCDADRSKMAAAEAAITSVL